MKDYYKILGIDHSAEEFMIKAAYRAHASKRHPDKSTDENSNSQMADINEAYTCLSDLVRRASYDQNFAKFKNSQTGSPIFKQEDDARNSTKAEIPPKKTNTLSRTALAVIGILLMIALFAANFTEKQSTARQDHLEAAIQRTYNNELLESLKLRDFEARIDRLFPDHLDFQLKSEIEQCKKLNTNIEYTNCINENENLSSKRLNLYKRNFEQIQDGIELSKLTKALFSSHEGFINEWCTGHTAYAWGGGSGTSQGVSHCKISMNAWFADILFTSSNSLKFQRFEIPPQIERSTNRSCTSQMCIDNLNITIDHEIELIKKHIQQNVTSKYPTLSKDDISIWTNSISHSNTRLVEIKNTLCTELPLVFRFNENQNSKLACENHIDQFRVNLFTETYQTLISE